tara:strand:- start:530 stop:745 length:216 start_codon:yes stop_codon:yes gene_type:complete
MQYSTREFVEEYKRIKEFEKQYKSNVIEFEDYFKNSGKREENDRFISLIPFYRKWESINNDMSKYKLKKKK